MVPSSTRLRGKQMKERSYRRSWRWYVRGHVVSKTAVRVIKRALMQIPADSQEGREKDDENETPDIEPLPANADVSLSSSDLREMLRRSGAAKAPAEGTSKEVHTAMQHGQRLWGVALDGRLDSATCARAPIYDTNLASGIKDHHGKTKAARTGSRGIARTKRSSATYPTPVKLLDAIQAWRSGVLLRDLHPDAKQLEIIDAVIARCVLEATAEHRDAIATCPGEPMLAIVHGLPGAGKSEIIKWLRELFLVLGWSQDGEFMCAAPMNSMASLIGGVTVHKLASLGIDLRPGGQRGGKNDATRSQPNELFTKLQAVRWLLIDEIENVSVELLAALDTQVQESTRSCPRSYAVRLDKTRRLLGGFNVIFFGDFWQVPPVQATSITANPFEKRKAKTRRILDMFRGRDTRDSLTHKFLLEVSHRSKDDPFLLAFLQEARAGALSWTMYNFIHGYDTLVPGSWLPGSDSKGILMCGNGTCERLFNGEWKELFASGANKLQLLDMECGACKTERVRRNRLLRPSTGAHLDPMWRSIHRLCYICYF
jgi:hypothetical protein